MYKQAQLNKQSLIKDQSYNYIIMGNLFSSLECYAKRNPNCPIQYKFQYYNNFDSGTDKTKEELLNQIITQIEIFKYSYLLYIKTHDKYDFPDNLNEETIVKYLEEWMEFVDKKDKHYYQGVIDIIKKKDKSISFVNEIKEKREEGNTIDPRFLVNNAPRIMTFSNQVGNNAIEQFKKNQDYRPQIVLGDQKPNNKYNNETKEREKKREQLQKQLDEQFFLFTLNLEKLCILHNISFSPMAIRIEEDDKQLEKLIDESYQKIYKDSNSLKQLNGMYIIESNPNISQKIERQYKILKNNLQGSNYTNVLSQLNSVIKYLSRCNESFSTTSLI